MRQISLSTKSSELLRKNMQRKENLYSEFVWRHNLDDYIINPVKPTARTIVYGSLIEI